MSSRTKRKAQRRKEQATEKGKMVAKLFCRTHGALELDGQSLVPDPETVTRADIRELGRIAKFGGTPSIGLQRRLVPASQVATSG